MILSYSNLHLAMETADPEEILLKRSKPDLISTLFRKMVFDGSNIVSG